MMLSIVILSISLSLDALGVGVAYGMRGVRIPIFPKLIICAFSIIYSCAAIITGKSLAEVFPVYVSRVIGTSILVIMGIMIILQTFLTRHSSYESKAFSRNSNETLLKFVIKSLGITIQVIKNPVEGDIDKSGIIDLPEAVLLGLALSLDAIGVGIGCAFTGFYSISIPFAIGLFQLAFLYVGTYLGDRFKPRKCINQKLVSVLPGLLLIMLAIIRSYRS